MISTVIVFAICANFVQIVSCCVCHRETIDEKTSSHEFGINATILSKPFEVELDYGPHREYRIKVNEILKASGRATQALANNVIYLHGGRTSCSIDPIKAPYTGLFFGDFDDSDATNKPLVGFCGFDASSYQRSQGRPHYPNTDVELVGVGDKWFENEWEMLDHIVTEKKKAKERHDEKGGDPTFISNRITNDGKSENLRMTKIEGNYNGMGVSDDEDMSNNINDGESSGSGPTFEREESPLTRSVPIAINPTSSAPPFNCYFNYYSILSVIILLM